MLRMSLRAVVAVLALVIANVAIAQDKPVTLKFAHWVPATHPLHKDGWAPWAKSIEAASGGSIKIEFYVAGQLGKPADHYDLARDGIADIAWLNPGFNPGRWPIAAAGMIPLLYNDGLNSSAALTEWYQKYAPTEMPKVKLCMLHSMHPGTMFTKKPIRTPKDLAGLKYRATSYIEAIYVRNAGGTNVNLPQPAIKEALRRGVADGTFNALNSVNTWGIAKEVKYVLDIPWGSSVFAMVINKAKYDGLSGAQRNVIDEHCTPARSRTFITGAVEFEKKGPAQLKATGHVFYAPNADEMKEWRTGIPAVEQAWASDVKSKGQEPDAIMSDLKTTLKKHGALLQ